MLTEKQGLAIVVFIIIFILGALILIPVHPPEGATKLQQVIVIESCQEKTLQDLQDIINKVNQHKF